ncbi:MAG TPA: response regulator, partial [Labilithrix sp.]|nr:response regulator [Labilithrix sp.]
ARDGLEAIELLGTIGILAMVVSDTALPQMDGFALAKVLRANPMTKRVPIMFVSNQNDAQHVKQALVIGVSHYLPKTTPVMAIVEKVRKIVV